MKVDKHKLKLKIESILDKEVLYDQVGNRINTSDLAWKILSEFNQIILAVETMDEIKLYNKLAYTKV